MLAHALAVNVFGSESAEQSTSISFTVLPANIVLPSAFRIPAERAAEPKASVAHHSKSQHSKGDRQHQPTMSAFLKTPTRLSKPKPIVFADNFWSSWQYAHSPRRREPITPVPEPATPVIARKPWSSNPKFENVFLFSADA